MKKIILGLTLFLYGNLTAQTITNYYDIDGLLDNNVNCLAIDNANAVWFGTQSGVSVLSGSGWASHTVSTSSGGMIDNNIMAIHCAANGDVWIGTDFGASRFNGVSWTSYTTASGLGNNQIKCITEDATGAIWFGTISGASKFNGSTWLNLGTAQGLPFGGVTEIDIHSNGDVWLGTGLTGVRVYNGVINNQITAANGLIDDRIRAMVMDNQGKKWIGTAEGISVLGTTNTLLTHYTTIFTLPAPDTLNPIEDMEMDSHGNIWVGVYVDYLVTEGGVSAYNGNQWIQYNVMDGLVGPVVRALAIDDNDDVWVATSTGVSKISDASIGFEENITGKNKPKVSLSPNPTNGHITVEISEGLNKEKMKIYTYSMELVGEYELGNSTQKLDVSNLASGMYFVIVEGVVKKLTIFK